MSRPMDPDRWRRAEDLFGRALEVAPDLREAMVAEASGGDDELRDEVLALLASVETASDYFARVASLAGIRSRERTDPETLVDRTLGPYHLVRLLGRGGMGAVFLARRADDEFEMEVALKLLPWGMISPEALDRFRRERQILARMEDPRIARILDGGTADDGTPYYVMEYVEGIPIDEYCDSHRLPLGERLRLFLEVCDAVEYAHRHFVVHRDLKPGNILVTRDDAVKLLDFGIARLLDPHDGRSERTGTGLAHPMTLSYASPEQVRGEPITAASDVYALGILLYKLLTGDHPYRSEFKSPGDAERVICEEDPTEPSRRVADATSAEVAVARETPLPKLQRELSGDLDAIVLMALRKEPRRRYPSVHQLSDDLRRHLDGYPVRARRDSPAYRLSRFVRRHTVGFAASLALVGLVLALAVVTVRHSMTTAAMSEALAREAETTREVSDFLVDLFRVSDALEDSGETVPVRTLLDEGVEELSRDTEGPPEVRAQTLTVMARVYDNLGLYDEAVMLLERALTLRRQLYGSVHADVAETLEALAESSERAREPAVALGYFEQALATRRALGDSPVSEASALQGMGRILRDQGKADSAEVLVREALRVRTATSGSEDLQTVLALLDLAFVLRARGELDSAQVLYERSIEGLETHGDSGAVHLPVALNNLAYVHRTRGESEVAESLYRQAMVLEEAWGTVPNLLLLMNNLAAVLDEQGKVDQADRVLETAIVTAEDHWPGGHWRVGTAYGARGMLHLLRGDPARAEPLLRTSMEVTEGALTPDHPRAAFARMQYGVCLTRLERFSEAERALRTALESFVAQDGDEGVRTQTALSNLIAMYEAWGRPTEAARLRQAVR